MRVSEFDAVADIRSSWLRRSCLVTWREHVVFVYSASDFKKIKELPFKEQVSRSRFGMT